MIDVPSVWIGDAPTSQTLALARAYAARAGVNLIDPAAEPPPATPREDANLAAAAEQFDACEDVLASAADARLQHDEGRAQALVTQAFVQIHAHPEWPNAVWILAEAEREQAAQLADREPTRAAILRAHARAVSPRAQSYGAAESTAVTVLPTATLNLSRLHLGRCALDARPPQDAVVSIAIGEHHVWCTDPNGGGVGRFFSVAADEIVVVATPLSALACSQGDLLGPDLRAHRQCSLWYRWRSEGPAAFGQLCRRDQCGIAVRLHQPPAKNAHEMSSRSALATWLPWAVMGASVVLAGTVIALDRTRGETDERFRAGGLVVH